ncbi:MAG: thiamine-phosphate kinase [Firmicutes bacterium HGW-Firmicutes-13]|nr:MAG: thiamine-phosphate kinase [Firmicutes bacterium HGW-Firmicutes-13]
MLISEIGEVNLIKRLAREAYLNPKEVLVGIGDDAAVTRLPGGKVLLITKDILVEGVHFIKDCITPRQLGQKALAVNISDIAAMGGTPKHVLTAVGLTPDTEVETVEELYRGIKDLCRLHCIHLVGGDTVRSPESMIISITLLGEVEEEYLTLRSGAGVGDLIGVTGYLGASGAGLDLLLESRGRHINQIPHGGTGLDLLLESRGPLSDHWQEEVIKAHLEPPVRLEESRALSRAGMVNAMIDLSDGIVKDLEEISRASGVGARIYMDRLPVSSATRKAAQFLQRETVNYALAAGEDYELLFTLKADKYEEFRRTVVEQLNTKITIIGEIVPEEKGLKMIDEKGRERDFPPRGFIHF